MANNTPYDNTPFYEYLIDDPEILASPLSPHFSPNLFAGAFDVRNRPHHATQSENQATTSLDRNQPNLLNESAAAAANQGRSTNGISGTVSAEAQHVAGLLLQHQHQQQQQQQEQQHHQQPRCSALGLGLLAAAGSQGSDHHHHHHQHHQQPPPPHQFVTAAAPSIDYQGPPTLFHAQGNIHQQAPAWFASGYGAPFCDSLQPQHSGTTSSSAEPTKTPVTISAPDSFSNHNNCSTTTSNTTAAAELFDFGIAAPPLAVQSFLGGDYADITPLSTAAAVTAHSQPTITFDFHSSPWRPPIQDSSSITLNPNIAVVAPAELKHDVRNHSTGSNMEDDSDVREPSWGEEDDNNDHGKPRARATLSSSTSPRPRRQQRKGKRRAVADPGANTGTGVVEVEDEEVPNSPAGRTSISGRSNKSASVASTTASSSKTAPAPAPRLRSASRTSKNVSQKPSETAEERRTRASHNLVEKQYRNRLNAQFEGLLNALPEQVRGPAVGGVGAADGSGGGDGGGGGGDESDPQPADQERRFSKAEVLDMARRHIKSLEQERNELQRERRELMRNLEVMEREMTATGCGRLDEFLDVDGGPHDRGGAPWRNA